MASIIAGFTLDVEHTAGLAVVAAGFIVSFAINPKDQLKPMLLSRKFWFSLSGFVFIFLDAFHVWAIKLDLAQMASLVIVIVSYVLMVAVDPGNGWRGLLVSRKFITAVVGLVIIFLDAFNVVLPAGFTSDQLISLSVLIGGSIAGFGLQGPPATLPDPVIPEEKE